MSDQKSGRPEAERSNPDAHETSTQNVSAASVPSSANGTSVAPAGGRRPGDDVAGVYRRLLAEPVNPVGLRLTQSTRQLDEARQLMLELLCAGHGPECTGHWTRLADQLQQILLDLDHLAADLTLLEHRLR